MIRRRAQLDTVNPPGQIVNPITGQRTLNDYYRDKKYLEAEQPAAPVVLTDAEIEKILAAHNMAPLPHRMNAARAILAAAIPEGYCVVKDEPVAWMFEYPDKRIAPKFDSAPHGGNWKPLYAARPGGEHD